MQEFISKYVFTKIEVFLLKFNSFENFYNSSSTLVRGTKVFLLFRCNVFRSYACTMSRGQCVFINPGTPYCARTPTNYVYVVVAISFTNTVNNQENKPVFCARHGDRWHTTNQFL